ncbi:MAG: ferredoxin--NADP reductase [Gammaproteobacteria bacterium]|nr:ferredoxin--NADP reductase [Gammaproteobacteria bacterium]
MSAGAFNLVFVSIKTLSEGLYHLQFKREDGQEFRFVPGQFITFMLSDNGQVKRRSYSLATIPGESTGVLDIAISYVEGGFASQLFLNLKPGDVLKAIGPVGRLIMKEEPLTRYILVGTGTGIAPYRAMLPDLLARCQRGNFQVEILLGVRTRKDALFKEDFLRFASQHPNLRFRVFYSRETLSDPESYESTGYVQQAFETLNLNPAEDAVYLCGNPNMIDEACELLQGRGFSIQNVRREKYISS